MISGGICGQGLGNLAFHTYNVNKFSYKQVLNFIMMIQKEIQELFRESHIPIWAIGKKIAGDIIPR